MNRTARLLAVATLGWGSMILVRGTVVDAQYAARPTAGVPTFSKDVAPILFKKCTQCHRPGEIAPMSLLTYEDARPYAESIVDELTEGAMPPWHADPNVGHFKNDRSLSAADKATLLNWAKNGAPRGNPADLPPAPKYVDGWTIGEPTVVLPIPVEYKVPEKGQI